MESSTRTPLDKQSPLEVMSGVFTFPGSTVRDDFLARETALYEESSVVKGLLSIASTQAGEFHKLTFERVMSKLTTWLGRHGKRSHLSKAEKNHPDWWAHGMPIKMSKYKTSYYGWLLSTRRGFDAVVYTGATGAWNHLFGKAEDAEYVEDGPPLPEVAVAAKRVRIALLKHPEPVAKMTEPEWREEYTAQVKQWNLQFRRFLVSLPGGDINWLDYVSYRNWRTEGFPLIPVGWEGFHNGKK